MAPCTTRKAPTRWLACINGVEVDLMPSIINLAQSGAGGSPVTIDSIDLTPTGNPDEFTVSITWTDGTGASQTTTDATPVTIVGGGATDRIVDADLDTSIDIVEGGAGDGGDIINLSVDGNVVASFTDTKLTLNGIFIDPATGLELTPQTAVSSEASNAANVIWLNSNNNDRAYRGSVNLEDRGAVDVQVTGTNLELLDDDGNVIGTAADLSPVVAGVASIDSIDLAATGNPNEYTVSVSWTDKDGNSMTSTDATPITVTGGTDLGYTAAPSGGSVTSSTGTAASIPDVDATNAGLATPAMLANSHQDDDVETVTGTAVDNTDPRNPVINAVSGLTHVTKSVTSNNVEVALGERTKVDSTGVTAGDTITVPDLTAASAGDRLEVFNDSGVELQLVIDGANTVADSPSDVVPDGTAFEVVVDADGALQVVGTGALSDLGATLNVVPAATAGTYISGATSIGTGTGQVNPVDWLIEELTVGATTKVTVYGRFDHWDEDQIVTITFPAGTMTSTLSAIATREAGEHTTPINMEVGGPLVYTINRDDGISAASGVSFQIVGLK